MPTLDDILTFLSFVPTTSALVVLAIASCLLVASRDWRMSIFAATLNYLIAGLLLTRIMRSDIALIKLLVGAMICFTLYITARRAVEAQPAPASQNAQTLEPGLPLRLETGWPFRLLVAILGLAVAGTAATRLTLPSTSQEIALACFILFTQGLLALSLTERPLKGGLGMLTVIIGFDLFYSGVQQSLVVVGLLGLVNFSIALAIVHLTTLQASGGEGEV